MVNILQRPKSIGELFAEQIGGGFQRGVDQGLSHVQRLAEKKEANVFDFTRDAHKRLLEEQKLKTETMGDLELLEELEKESDEYSTTPWFTPWYTKGDVTKKQRQFGKSTPDTEKASHLDSMGKWVADKAYVKFNKGQISEKKLDWIMSNAPSTKLTKAENKGRIKALKQLLMKEGNITDEDLKRAEKTIGTSSSSRPPLDSFRR